jgi:outer membrane protein assembly factor BamB
VAPVRTRLLLSFSVAAVLPVASIVANVAGSAQNLPSSVRWSVPVSARPAAPPVIDGAHVFVVLQPGIIAAHRVSDGGEAWRVELRAEHPVAVDGTHVFIASGEMIHALNASTAEVLWRAPAGAVTAPLVAHEGWVIAATANALTAFRGADGSRVWSRGNSAQHERPTIEADNLYVPLDDGHVLALDLQTGAERWSRHFAGPVSEVLAFADRVYVGSADKHFYCLDADDGETSWRHSIGTTLRGRPAGDDSRVFAAAIDNMLRAFDRRSGALLWHPSVPFRPTSGPVVLGSVIVASGRAPEVRAFEAASGRPAGQIALGGEPGVAPAFGTSGGSTVMAVISGSLDGEWKLRLMEAPLPSVPIAPLTELPGIIVPVEPPALKR